MHSNRTENPKLYAELTQAWYKLQRQQANHFTGKGSKNIASIFFIKTSQFSHANVFTLWWHTLKRGKTSRDRTRHHCFRRGIVPRASLGTATHESANGVKTEFARSTSHCLGNRTTVESRRISMSIIVKEWSGNEHESHCGNSRQLHRRNMLSRSRRMSSKHPENTNRIREVSYLPQCNLGCQTGLDSLKLGGLKFTGAGNLYC